MEKNFDCNLIAKYIDIDSYIMYLKGEMITDNFCNDHRYYYDEKGKKKALYVC